MSDLSTLVKKRGGVLLLDKPCGPTSHDMVQMARRCLRHKRIGHCGTLDPLASGLLLLVVGESTRLANYATLEDKSYDCELELGLTTDSHDIDGQVVERKPVGDISGEDIELALATQRGDIQQIPPIYSAVHVDGQRAYQLARQGEKPVLQPRDVRVHQLSLVERKGNRLHITAKVSKGAYIRSLVRDIGEKLGCGATVVALRRTSSGHLSVANAVTQEQLQQENPWSLVDSPLALFPESRQLLLDAERAQQMWANSRIKSPSTLPQGEPPWLAVTEDDVVAVVKPEQGLVRTVRGFPA